MSMQQEALALSDTDLSGGFTSARAAALARAQALDPARYARSRNFLSGHVSRLSPYITHGLISVPEVLHEVSARHRLGWHDKIVFELAWREYFQHAWRCLGSDILRDQHAPPARHYTQTMPQDIVAGATGVPLIDAQVRELYATGYLHNHARMWLASYIVHLRKVDWRAGAAWMYAYLLDGDLASNTLSWQWVAGTWTGKPYLFNADNVLRYAGIDHRGTALDRSYEELDVCARSGQIYAERPGPRAAIAPPPIGGLALFEAPRLDAQNVPKGDLWLMHPWSLDLPPQAQRQPVVGVLVNEFHAAHAWSIRRFDFVLAAMRARCDVLVAGSLAELAQALGGRRVHAVATRNPHYAHLLDVIGAISHAAPRAFADPPQFKKSFSSYWNTVSRGAFPV
jgi:deoxyribodipyrimidine photo-lyase